MHHRGLSIFALRYRNYSCLMTGSPRSSCMKHRVIPYRSAFSFDVRRERKTGTSRLYQVLFSHSIRPKGEEREQHPRMMIKKEKREDVGRKKSMLGGGTKIQTKTKKKKKPKENHKKKKKPKRQTPKKKNKHQKTPEYMPMTGIKGRGEGWYLSLCEEEGEKGAGNSREGREPLNDNQKEDSVLHPLSSGAITL